MATVLAVAAAAAAPAIDGRALLAICLVVLAVVLIGA